MFAIQGRSLSPVWQLLVRVQQQRCHAILWVASHKKGPYCSCTTIHRPGNCCNIEIPILLFTKTKPSETLPPYCQVTGVWRLCAERNTGTTKHVTLPRTYVAGVF